MTMKPNRRDTHNSFTNLTKTHKKYNISGKNEISNLDIARRIAAIMCKSPQFRYTADAVDRPGHDVRYGLDGSKLDDMGFKYPVDFEESLDRTIKWTLSHPVWLGNNTDNDKLSVCSFDSYKSNDTLLLSESDEGKLFDSDESLQSLPSTLIRDEYM